jgi:hypothetical protein
LSLKTPPPKIAALKIIELFEKSEELEIYQYGEISPIYLDEYNSINMTAKYHDITKPEKQKTIDYEGIQKIIREIRNTQTKKPE